MEMSEYQDLAYTRIAHMVEAAILLLVLTFTIGVFVGIVESAEEQISAIDDRLKLISSLG